MSDPLCVNIHHTQCYCSNKLADNDRTLERRAECLKVMEAVARRKQWSGHKKGCATLETCSLSDLCAHQLKQSPTAACESISVILDQTPNL